MDIRTLRNNLIDATVVLVGNGPSLDRTPLEELSRKYVTFGQNHIYKKPFTPTYYAYADFDIKSYLPFPEGFAPKEKFVRAEVSHLVPGSYPIYPIVMPVNFFSTDISNFVVFGGSTTYILLQIALFMGVKTVLLVGVDHYYPVAGDGKPGVHFTAGDTDPDHFAGGYYVPGKKYTRPSLDVVKEYFRTADGAYKNAGSRIYNCTPDTHLDVFEKREISEWL